MKRLLVILIIFLGLYLSTFAQAQSKLPPCPTDVNVRWHNCFGTFTWEDGAKFVGEWKNSNKNGRGIFTFADGRVLSGIFADGKFIKYEMHALSTGNQKNDVTENAQTKNFNLKDQDTGTPAEHNLEKYYVIHEIIYANGDKYVGEFKDGIFHGRGIKTFANGSPDKEGIWEEGKFVRAEKVNLPPVNQQTDIANNQGYNHRDQTNSAIQNNPNKLELCPKNQSLNFHNCWGSFYYSGGQRYEGEWLDNKKHGLGTYIDSAGNRQGGLWSNGKFDRAENVNLPPVQQKSDVAINEERRRLDADRQALEFERQRLTEERNRREQAKQLSKLSLQTTTTNPDVNGNVTITVRTNADTSSLKVNGEEQGGNPDGNYIIKKVARVGQDTQFTIIATDINGNTESKTITVSRKAVESTTITATLNPENIKTKSSRDAVALIIGISNYKSLPRADFAKDDAQVFYDYAIRALGVKPENIKLLLDADAEEIEIFKAFKTWLPARVKPTTDVYVFYSGHGLPTSDGLGLYLLPYRADRDLISKTAIQFQEINSDIQAAKPKSVTIFMDACYSGQSRGGETLIASARPLALKVQTTIFPSSFSVFSASQSDQISSSSPELKHGIFSYYLMKGMEGDADANKDGKITLGEMQGYLAENVGRQAGMMNRKQEPQLIGDANRVLVGK
jgi:hypothetical protein